MKLDELVEDVMNLDINKESMDDNRSHSQDLWYPNLIDCVMCVGV